MRGYPRDAGEGTDARVRSPLDGEPLFAAYFHSSAHAMALTRTSDGVVVAVNDAMTQLFGYSRDDVVGRSAADLGVRPTWEGRNAAVADLRAGKLLEDIELRIPARDGRTFSVNASAQLLEDTGEGYLHWVLRERSQSRVVAEALSSAVSEQDAVPLLEAVLDAAPVAIALYDRLGRCVRVNAQLRNGPGGDPTGKLITDTHPQFAPLVDAVFDTGQALYNSELRGDPGGRGGGSGWWLVSYLPVHVEDGTLVSVGVVAVDLTERKAFEQALLESERRLRQLLETMELAAVMTNIDGEITFVNDHLLGLTGFPRDELLGRRWVDTLAVPGREADNVRFHGRLQEGELITPFSAYVRTRDGGSRLVRWHSTMLLDSGGRVVGVASIGEDVTEQRRASEALAESERRFRDVLETIDLLAIMVTADGAVLFANDAVLAALGRPPDDVVGRDWVDVLAPVLSPTAARAAARDAMGLERRPPRELSITVGSGERRILRWHTTPLHEPGGKVTGWVGIGEDETERRRTEQALLESEEHRQRVLAAMIHAEEDERGRIAGELHDDTVQVMTATLLALDRVTATLRRGGDAQPQIETARSTLEAAVERTRRLMFELRPPTLDLQGLAAALRELLDQLAADSPVSVHLEVPEGRYPPMVERIVYRTIREAIANVRKHAEASQVRVVVADDGRSISGEVADDGVGFDPEQARRDRARLRTHMGLDAAEERVQLAGGELAVESAVGSGTRLRFHLPLADPAGGPPAKPERRR